MADEDLLISAGFSASKLAKSAQEVIAVAKRTGEQAEKAFNDATGRVTNTEAARANTRALERMAQSYDPVYRAQVRYKKQVGDLNALLASGKFTQDQYNAAIKRSEDALRKAGDSMQQAGRMGGTGLQNLGYQVGDFAVQVGAGASAAQAFGQQLPQLLGGFGAVGALMGAGAAIAIPLGAALLKVAMDTETLDDKLESLEKTTSAYLDAVDAQATPLDQLRVQYGDLADEIQRVNDVTASLTRVSASRDLLGSANKFGAESFGASTWRSNVLAAFQQQAGVEETAVERLARVYSLSASQADKLQMARRRLETSNSEEAVRKDAENLLNVLVQISGSADEAARRFPQEMQAVNTMIKSAADQIAATDRAHRQAQQDLLDTYDANTQKLKKLADERKLAEDSQTQAVKDGKADQAAAYGRVIKAIDDEVKAVKKSIAEMDGTFEASVKRMKELSGEVGGAIDNAIKNWTGLNLSEWGTAGAASQKGILDLIASQESKGSGDYNAAWGGAKFTGGNLSLVNMTLNEILGVQKQMLAHPDNTANSSALGRYQIVGTTLKGLMKELGLTGNELFDKDMQDRLATQLVRRRLPQGVEGLRNEWEGLRNVPSPLIEQALNQQSIPREDAETAAERKKTLQEEVREREKLQQQALEYGKQLASNLLTEKQTAELTAKRTAEIAKIKASGASDADQSAAIAAVNADFEKQATIYSLTEDAKRRQVDLDHKMTGSAMTYREAMAALAQTKADSIIVDEQTAAQAEQVAKAQADVENAVNTLSQAFTDAILGGESLRDSLASIFKQIAANILNAGIQNALSQAFSGAGGGGGGFLGAIGSAIVGGLSGKRASGGSVRAGGAYLVNENTPNSEVFVPSVNGAILNVAQAQQALRGRAGGNVTNFAPQISIGGNVTQGDIDRVMVAMRSLRSEVPQIVSNNNKRRG